MPVVTPFASIAQPYPGKINKVELKKALPLAESLTATFPKKY